MRGSIPAWAGEPYPPLRGRESRRVYPRVGGGTLLDLDVIGTADGLSPCGRGNLCRNSLRSIIEGSIPAWAGEPKTRCRLKGKARVYPRVGGGTAINS